MYLTPIYPQIPVKTLKYTFSLGCPEYPFDAGTGSCTPGDLKYSGNATRGPASGVTGTVEYGKDELPTSDTSMSMSGKLIPPEGTEGSQPTWSASATLQSPFWLEASPSDIVKAGTAVTVTAKGDPTESTWTIDGLLESRQRICQQTGSRRDVHYGRCRPDVGQK